LIPLAEEIGFAHAYLDIEAVRFSDRLRVSWDVEPGVEAGLVPALLLQPLIENAVRHAVAPRREGGVIHVRITRDEGDVVIDVSDDGPGFGASCAEPGARTGLNNTRDRLHAAFGDSGGIELGRSTSGGARVTVRLPFVDSGAAVPVGATP
ncbi:MAG TPA: ATP-binding protein, partial [Longimicrobiales bacterium]|nr:ATP-binding protein [Longimicrobiales bacterium]